MGFRVFHVLKLAPDCLCTQLLYPGLVHERAVIGADFYFEAGWLRVAFRSECLHKGTQTLLGHISHNHSQRIRWLILRYLRSIEPGAIGITEKIITRLGREISTCQIESPRAIFRPPSVLPRNCEARNRAENNEGDHDASGDFIH